MNNLYSYNWDDDMYIMDTKQADMITLLFFLLCNGLPVGNQALIRP